MKPTLVRFLATAMSWPRTSFAQQRAVPYVTGLSLPVGFVQDPPNLAIQLLVQQKGLIRAIDNGVLQAAPFLDLSSLVAQDGGERGLFGLAFPRDYGSARRFFVNYTRAGDAATVISRYTRSAASVLSADPNTRFDLQWPQGPSIAGFIGQPFANHKTSTSTFPTPMLEATRFLPTIPPLIASPSTR